jgi:arylsulfatase A-like enzyme
MSLVPSVLALLASPVLSAQENILLVVADDLGIDQLASYGVGANVPNTPILDLMAANGIRFRNAYANPTCSPSRASLQTGRHPFRTGVGDGVDESTYPLPLWETTIPEMLDAGGAGYAHAAFGKWHLGNSIVGGKLAPNLAGYGHYAGVLGNLGPGASQYFNYKKVTNGVAQTTSGYLTTDTVDDALAWIGGQSGPWFCYLAFHAPHQPFHAPPAELHTVNLSGVAPPDVEPRPYYRAMVEALDTELGRLLIALGPATLENTWVFFLGDNGTPFAATAPPFDPFHAKGTVYEGGVHVPLIAFRLGMNAAGAWSDALVSIVDLYATIADIAGVSPTPEVVLGPQTTGGTGMVGPFVQVPLPAVPVIDSISLMPYLIDPSAPSQRAFVLGERYTDGGAGQTLRTLREARFKYLEERYANPIFDRVRLFDVESDPFELDDLLTESPLSPAAVRAMRLLESALDALIEP